ncbi:FabD/lysophospholipase-like protein [Lindgomyces ingoldianus]|uniref:FabD/lysophospholipase-like protein n=1 Tax=Lindgomyces ingoldianus TaxID=673940 RepID=A0ACB6QN15_9PLEO|nr:FabD/lysophospholipase-like protein [Lindgomyces ingoldianus]KAF2468373.1 FabD/lysophospholipase-like protein [Lindgomyces ingoldianus]
MSRKDLRLLALDGGGVRGLSSLMILQQLMETVNPDAPPKPCDYFDMIGGTSTGGLLAIMLGRLKMGIDECISAYLSLSDHVFQKKRHRVTVKGKIQGRFDSDALEGAVKKIMKEQGHQEDVLLKDAPDSVCKVFLCATSKETSETVCLTSYKSPRGNTDLLNSVKIWEACRATSAASSFFDPIAIGRFKEEFVDGATGANNPVMELWNEAQLMWGVEPLEGKLQCLVSIGTGIPSLKPFPDDVLHIGEALVAIATETERTAERFRRDKAYLDDSSRYFRFNVVRGLEDIGLEESAKAKEIAAATRRYVTSQETFKQMQACAKNLRPRDDESSPDPSKDPLAALLSQLSTRNSSPFRQEIVMAAKDGDADLVKALLQKGADVNAKGDLDNLTPLWWAAYKGYPEVAKVLIDTGKAKLDEKDGYLVTPFFWAAQNGHDAVVELLLQTGKVDVNVKNKMCRTPLSLAAGNGEEALVKRLLETGKADLDGKDRMNRTPLAWAIAKKQEGVVKLLQSYGSS